MCDKSGIKHSKGITKEEKGFGKDYKQFQAKALPATSTGKRYNERNGKSLKQKSRRNDG